MEGGDRRERGHDAAAEAAGKAYAAFNGNPAFITEARELLAHEKELSELTVRQLKQLLLNAAEGPMTNPDLVNQRVEAETKQASILNSFEFKLNGKPITANEIDDKLENEHRSRGAQGRLGSVEGVGPGLESQISSSCATCATASPRR